VPLSADWCYEILLRSAGIPDALGWCLWYVSVSLEQQRVCFGNRGWPLAENCPVAFLVKK